jgi:aconitate hydratase
MEKSHPFAHLETTLTVGSDNYKMFNINKYIEDKKLPHQLPFCIRVLLESAIRNCDDFNIKRKLFFIFLNIFSR